MKAIRDAYATFWGSFCDPRTGREGEKIPAFACHTPVAPTAAFPYITYDVALAPFGTATLATAHIWDSSPLGGQTSVVDGIIEQVKKRIPDGGCVLEIKEKSHLWLLRSTPFIDYMFDSKNPTLVRGVVRLSVKYYGI